MDDSPYKLFVEVEKRISTGYDGQSAFMIDGWIGELDSSDDLETMMEERDRRQAGLGEGNKATGEHYGAIDQRTGQEVDCLIKDRGVGY
jgi:hypothetical protein